jgi:hypothetical protein
MKIPVIIWLVAYSAFCGLGVLALVGSFFLVSLDPVYQIVLGINVGELVRLFTRGCAVKW